MHTFSRVTALLAIVTAVAAGITPAHAVEEATWGETGNLTPPAGITYSDTEKLDDFYDITAQLPEGLGEVVKTLPGTVYVDPNKVIPGPASGTRFMYTTENSHGEHVAATAVALRSESPWTGEGSRPLVVLAPGTQGLADHCAPTNQLAQGTEYEIIAISALLSKGYNVTVIDYIGGGTEGTLSYLNRIDQGHAVLDAARASTGGGINFVPADSPVAIWGYSQGGGAVASAGELHAEYAPDVNLHGIFAGAVPADLQAVINTIDGTTYNGFALMGIAGLGDSLNMDLNQYLTPEGLAVIDQVRNETCTFDAISRFGSVRDTSVWTLSGLTLKQLSGLDVYLHSALRENSLGEEGRHPDVPVLIASSITDDVIPHRSNRQLAASYCRAGSEVSFYAAATPTHAGGALGTMPAGMIFLDQVFNGTPTSYDCARVGA